MTRSFMPRSLAGLSDIVKRALDDRDDGRSRWGRHLPVNDEHFAAVHIGVPPLAIVTNASDEPRPNNGMRTAGRADNRALPHVIVALLGHPRGGAQPHSIGIPKGDGVQ